MASVVYRVAPLSSGCACAYCAVVPPSSTRCDAVAYLSNCSGGAVDVPKTALCTSAYGWLPLCSYSSGIPIVVIECMPTPVQSRSSALDVIGHELRNFCGTSVNITARSIIRLR
jgi:hypothetical protein